MVCLKGVDFFSMVTGTRLGSLLLKAFQFLLFLGFIASLFMAYISSWNYPGGYALHQLHQLEDNNASVHVDVYSHSTGANWFSETRYDYK